ncbi:hypothetical protein ARTHRO9AX_10266 [Arthrobacter sp. 9AX]|nr:hypothetical protein ARTHRO9AX_10266 [Arthrobacter sp. 9AX]
MFDQAVSFVTEDDDRLELITASDGDERIGLLRDRPHLARGKS